MASVLQVGTDLFFSEDVSAAVDLPLLGSLGHYRLKFFDDEHDAEIIKAIEGGVAVAKRKFERPAGNVDDAVAQLVKSEVAVLFFEAVDSFFPEFDLHEVESVAKHDHRYVLVHIGAKGFDSLFRKRVFPVTAGFHEQF